MTGLTIEAGGKLGRFNYTEKTSSSNTTYLSFDASDFMKMTQILIEPRANVIPIADSSHPNTLKYWDIGDCTIELGREHQKGIGEVAYIRIHSRDADKRKQALKTLEEIFA